MRSMSRDRAIRYVCHVVIDQPGRAWTPSEWRTRPQGQIQADGKPTTENLRKHCEHYERSTQPGGCNSHLGATQILSARIVDQNTGETVASYQKGT